MIKLIKPKFWDKKYNILTFLLLPLSFLWLVLLNIRNIFQKQTSFKAPIICVGNIYLGGTGKTPLSIQIVNEFNRIKKPVIVRKYYKNHKDEYDLIFKKAKYLIYEKKRSFAINKAIGKKFNLIILDDGFQDLSIKKDLNILCFNSEQLIGNGFVLPAGPLRESFSSIKKAEIIVINGQKKKEFEDEIKKISSKTKIFYTKYTPQNIYKFKNKNILAFAGIGNPHNFFKMLKRNNLNIKKTIVFPDHYEYKKSDLKKIIDESRRHDLKVLTTEKDFSKIKNFKIRNIDYVETKLEIFDKKKFLNSIKQFIW